MYCPYCKIKMREKHRLSHKKKKWVCPRCGFVRMQRIKKGRRDEISIKAGTSAPF